MELYRYTAEYIPARCGDIGAQPLQVAVDAANALQALSLVRQAHPDVTIVEVSRTETVAA